MEGREHTLKLEGNRLTVTGVNKVISFDDKEVKASLTDSGITVKGSGLSVEDLDIAGKILVISGKVSAFFYDARQGEKEPFLKRLLK